MVFDSWRFVIKSFKFCCLFIVLHWFEMEIPVGHFRHILLYYFRKVKNAVQAWKNLCDVYGENSLTERQCQNWFARLRSGDFDLKDAPRSGRLTEVDEKIKAMIENNRRSTTQEIAEKLNISHTCVERHLEQLGYVNKFDIWVPHEWNEIQLTKRISICDSMLKRNGNDPFLKWILTGDEEWDVYDKIVQKRSWSKWEPLKNHLNGKTLWFCDLSFHVIHMMIKLSSAIFLFICNQY